MLSFALFIALSRKKPLNNAISALCCLPHDEYVHISHKSPPTLKARAEDSVLRRLRLSTVSIS